MLPPGFFTPIDDHVQGAIVAIEADAIDPATGEYLSLLDSVDPTDAAVLLALSTKRGSGSTVIDKGQRFSDLQLNTDTAPQFLLGEAELALKRLVVTRQIKLEKAKVLRGPDWNELQLEYRNLAERRPDSDTARVPIAGLS